MSFTHDYRTADEISYIRDLARRNQFALLEKALRWTDCRRWDDGIDVNAVRSATYSALIEVERRIEKRPNNHPVILR